MWSSDRLRRIIAGIAVAVGFGLLSGCSFAPVYGDYGADAGQLAVSYAAPHSRLDQIVYQELALRLGTSQSPDAAMVAVTVAASARALALSVTTDPEKPYEVTAYASVNVTRAGKTIASFSRTAAADYTTSGQVLADRAALADASERAARAVAESIRLGLLGVLAP